MGTSPGLFCSIRIGGIFPAGEGLALQPHARSVPKPAAGIRLP
jgi:hypothetical protein